jgi:putative ABC transport system permease protein
MSVQRIRGTGANLLITITGAVLVTIVPGLQAGAADVVAGSLFGGSAAVRLILGLLFWAFLAVAVAVATTTATNAFAVVLTGRLEEIALRRLLGSSAARERARLQRLGTRIGLVGCLLGAGGGTTLLVVMAPAGLGSGWTWLSIAVGLAAMFAATRVGVRRAADQILAAAPVTGLRLTRLDESRRGDGGRGPVPALFLIGLVVLLGSVPASIVTPFAIFIGVVGGIATMVGSLHAMGHVLPVVLRVAQRLLPAHGTPALAVRLLTSRPGSAARAATGLFTGTAVVTTFVVALSTLTGALAASYQRDPAGAEAVRTLQSVTASIGLMISLIVVLSGIGLATSLTHSIQQRRREIATLRIMGQRGSDARRAVVAEAAVLCSAALVPGLLLGTLTGWIGAQDVLGAVRELGVLPPVIPIPLLLAAVVGAVVLVAVITRVSSRHVLAAAPIRALADA